MVYAEEYSNALGRKISYVGVPPEEWRDSGSADLNLPAHVFQHILTMARPHAANRYDRITHDVETITRKARDQCPRLRRDSRRLIRAKSRARAGVDDNTRTKLQKNGSIIILCGPGLRRRGGWRRSWSSVGWFESTGGARRRARSSALTIASKLLRPIDAPLSSRIADLALDVIHEDASVIVVNKPGGVPCHPLNADERDTVMNAVVARFPEIATVGEKPLEGGLVHRLDNGTSGALLIARNRGTFDKLRDAIRAGRIARRYEALVAGALERKTEIDAPIAHHAKNARKMIVGDPSSAESETRRPRRDHRRRSDSTRRRVHPAFNCAEDREPPSDSRASRESRASDCWRHSLWRPRQRNTRARALLAASM